MKAIPNTYKVPKTQWRKWNQTARFVFNELFSAMKGNQWALTSPQQDKLTPKMWRTVAWNAAWLAADAVRNFRKQEALFEKGHAFDDLNRKGMVVRTRRTRASWAATVH